MKKKLTRTGNSLALVLDRELLEATGIDVSTSLEVSTDGEVIVIHDELEASEHFFDQPCQLAYANSGPSTSGSQFFITEVPTLHLNPVKCDRSPSGLCGYVRFGEGVCGCDLVGKIARAGNGKTTLEKVVISKTKPSCQ